MQLVEQHVIDRKDPRFVAIDAASKNLYNAALYIVRQGCIHEGHIWMAMQGSVSDNGSTWQR